MAGVVRSRRPVVRAAALLAVLALVGVVVVAVGWTTGTPAHAGVPATSTTPPSSATTPELTSSAAAPTTASGPAQVTTVPGDPGRPVGDPAPVPAPARSVLIVGDSGMVDASPALAAAYLAAGADRAVNGATSGFGLTGGDGWRSMWRDLVARTQPDLVIVTMGGWDTQYLEREGDDAYAALVDEAVGVLSAGGARVLWTSMLPGGHDPGRPADRVYQALPARHPGVVGYVELESALRAPAGATVIDTPAEAPQWPRAYLDQLGRTVLLRKPDDWHLCPEGAERVASLVQAATAELGWSTLAPIGWQDGAWRTSAHYDDPPGGCLAPSR
jgi:lysophospholipase L1-like esterase